MRPYLPFLLCAALFTPSAHAQDGGTAALCRAVAHHLWLDVATAPLSAQTPLAQLKAAAPAAFQSTTTDSALAKPGQSIADALIQDHAAPAELVQQLRETPPDQAVKIAGPVWLLDRVDGTLACHTSLVVTVPPNAPAQSVTLPDAPDPSDLCALSELTGVIIDGSPALWIEQSGAFSNSLTESTVSLAALHGDKFDAPCELTVAYAIAHRTTHAVCPGTDCVPLMRTAEILAMRLGQGENAESLGAGAIPSNADPAEYRKMEQLAANDQQATELPTFGVSLNTPYLTFADPVIFPLRMDDGTLYLAKLGHGGFGWRQTADTLLALYSLKDGRLTAVASLYVSAVRTGIAGVSIQ